MTTQPPLLILGLLLGLSATASAQERTVLASKGDRKGQVLVLETTLDMERGFDRRTLITLDSPDNTERRRLPLLDGRRAGQLMKAGDWELFRALEDRALEGAMTRAAGKGFAPVTRRRDLRSEGTASFTFTWGGAPIELRLVPGRRRAELFLRRNPDGPERRLTRILPATVPGPDGPMELGADALREVALVGNGRILLVVVGAWDPEGGRRVGWERVVLLPLKKTARLWGLPYPLDPLDNEWQTP